MESDQNSSIIFPSLACKTLLAMKEMLYLAGCGVENLLLELVGRCD
jgi:hypothetical protein